MENNKRNKKKLALNCAIGALALLGSAGTITFGTLWCQSRNNGGTPQPTDDVIEKDLKQHRMITDPGYGTVITYTIMLILLQSKNIDLRLIYR